MLLKCSMLMSCEKNFFPEAMNMTRDDIKNNKDSKAMITVKLINHIRTSFVIMNKATAMVRIVCILVVHCAVGFELKSSVSTPSADQCLRTYYMHNYLSHNKYNW